MKTASKLRCEVIVQYAPGSKDMIRKHLNNVYPGSQLQCIWDTDHWGSTFQFC